MQHFITFIKRNFGLKWSLSSFLPFVIFGQFGFHRLTVGVTSVICLLRDQLIIILFNLQWYYSEILFKSTLKISFLFNNFSHFRLKFRLNSEINSVWLVALRRVGRRWWECDHPWRDYNPVYSWTTMNKVLKLCINVKVKSDHITNLPLLV